MRDTSYKHRKYVTELLTKEFLQEEYFNKKKSIKTLAQEFNCAAKTISEKIDLFKIKRHGGKKSFEDLTGKQFNKLRVLHRGPNKYAPNGTPRITWDCICECGNIVNRYSGNLKAMKSSCCNDCKIKEEQKSRKYGVIYYNYFNNLKKSALERNLTFSISIKDISFLLKKQNFKCALSGININFAPNKKTHQKSGTTASLDRIDSSKGYTKNNIQWIYKPIQFMKRNMSDSEFIMLCTTISKYNGKKT